MGEGDRERATRGFHRKETPSKTGCRLARFAG